jgi:hypothetical protein
MPPCASSLDSGLEAAAAPVFSPLPLVEVLPTLSALAGAQLIPTAFEGVASCAVRQALRGECSDACHIEPLTAGASTATHTPMREHTRASAASEGSLPCRARVTSRSRMA